MYFFSPLSITSEMLLSPPTVGLEMNSTLDPKYNEMASLIITGSSSIGFSKFDFVDFDIEKGGEI